MEKREKGLTCVDIGRAAGVGHSEAGEEVFVFEQRDDRGMGED